MANSVESAWDEIRNKCLLRALKILDDKYELNNGGLNDVDQLAGIAIAIEDLRLRRASQCDMKASGNWGGGYKK